ncbi:acylneuraminate cytidylyltransferase family protein [bacterium]|nr:acylneuraminate cytidylyltransferase family protein [bacterium]
MIDGKKVLAVIPARLGSKRLPRKNIRPFRGKPLLAWSIEEARRSKFIDRLILSSESEEIISLAKKYGCEAPFTRPTELATDTASGISPILHAIEMIGAEFDYVVMLQVTSPLRTAADMDGCIELCHQSTHPCVSVTEVTKSPYWMVKLEKTGSLTPILGSWENFEKSSQHLPPAFVPNGAVYVASTDHLKKKGSFYGPGTVGYAMPQSRSVDIDTEADFVQAESLLS